MQSLFLFVAISLSLAGASAAQVGTNGAGETCTWSGPERPYNKPINAKFISIANGQVELSYTEDVDKNWRDPYGRHFHMWGKATCAVYVPLAKLSASNRRWVEDRNPCETSLSERSKDGAVGTLTLRNGVYRITKIVDDDTALIDCVQHNKVAWSFELHSKLVQSMDKPQYVAISCDGLIPNFNGLPQNAKEQYGVDFKVSRSRVKKGVVVVEDNR